MKKNNFFIIFYGIFGLVGIVLILSGIIVFKKNTEFKENAEEIVGEITRIEKSYDSDGDAHHDVYVTYTYNGNEYDDVLIDFYSSGMFEGKEIALLCDPRSPKRVHSKTSINTVGGVVLFAGSIFALIGVVPVINTVRKAFRSRKLRKSGTVLYATVESIDYNRNYTVNGKHPFIIYCTYKDEYKDILYRFKSDNLWTDPSSVFYVGGYIEVMVDPNDYSKYYVKAEEVVDRKVADYT